MKNSTSKMDIYCIERVLTKSEFEQQLSFARIHCERIGFNNCIQQEHQRFQTKFLIFDDESKWLAWPPAWQQETFDRRWLARAPPTTCFTLRSIHGIFCNDSIPWRASQEFCGQLTFNWYDKEFRKSLWWKNLLNAY